MHEGLSSLCKFYGGKYLMGTVLSLWTSSYTVTSPLKLVNPWVFTNSQLRVQTVDW